MPRRPRIQLAGALYHVTIRGNNRAAVFLDDDDRREFVDRLGRAKRRHGWVLHAYCLMSNHYHLLVETPEPNIAKGMQWLNSSYSHWFNQGHGRIGHLFQRRYADRLLVSEEHRREVLRYIPLNPVRGGLCERPEQWPWSSYAATVGLARREPFLSVRPTLALFSSDIAAARLRYRDWVAEGRRRSPRSTRAPLISILPPGRAIDADQLRLARAHGYSVTDLATYLGIGETTVRRRMSCRGDETVAGGGTVPGPVPPPSTIA